MNQDDLEKVFFSNILLEPILEAAEPGLIFHGSSGGLTDKLSGSCLSRKLTINGRQIDVCLEAYVWDSIDEICKREILTLNQFAKQVAEKMGKSSALLSSLRVHALEYFRKANPLQRKGF